jgi:phage shock protein C
MKRVMPEQSKGSPMQANQNAVHQVEAEFQGPPDSLFGVCQSVGEHLGFNPLYLRIALFVLMFFNPIAMAVAYAALGAVVGLSHIVFPKSASTPWNPETAVEQIKAEPTPELLAA